MGGEDNEVSSRPPPVAARRDEDSDSTERSGLAGRRESPRRRCVSAFLGRILARDFLRDQFTWSLNQWSFNNLHSGFNHWGFNKFPWGFNKLYRGLWGQDWFLRREAVALPAMRNGWLAKPYTNGIEILEVAVSKIGVAFTEVIDSLVHPVPLIIFFGLEDPTTINVTEELVSSPAYRVVIRHYSLLYPHGR
jgi:hypothetical protein